MAALTASSVKGQSYRPSTFATYTAGATSGEQFAAYEPPLAPHHYQINAAHPDTYTGLVIYNFSGFNSSPPTFSDSTADDIDFDTTSGLSFGPLAWKCGQNGIKLFVVQVTAPATTNVGGTVPTGNGYQHARGGSQRYYEGGRNGPYKDAVAAFQYIRKRAKDYRIHGPTLGVGGDSAGGCLASWLAGAPDRAWEMMHGDFEVSTVPGFFVGGRVLTLWWDRWQNAVGTSVTGALFPQTELGTGNDVVATDLQTMPSRYKREFSTLSHMLPGVVSSCPMLLIAGATATTPANLNFSLPMAENVETAANVHTSFMALCARKLFKNFWLSFADTADGIQAATDGADITPDMYDFLHDGTTSSDGTPAAYRVNDKDAGPDIAWILQHANDGIWTDRPDAVQHRSGQLDAMGRFILPPGSNNRVVRISAASGESPVVYGYGHSDVQAVGVVAPGKTLDVQWGCDPMWARSGNIFARYGARLMRGA